MREMRQLLDLEEFREAKGAGTGVIVITDSTGQPVAHHPDCPFVREQAFLEKVVENERRSGEYFWCRDRSLATERLAANPCGHCF
jgi:hypothetical protein